MGTSESLKLARIAAQHLHAGDKPILRLELATEVISARSERIPRKKNGSQTRLDDTQWLVRPSISRII